MIKITGSSEFYPAIPANKVKIGDTILLSKSQEIFIYKVATQGTFVLFNEMLRKFHAWSLVALKNPKPNDPRLVVE
jgi:hypothetical protein